MVPPFQLIGPSKNPYPGTVCLPQVPLPAGANVKAGDNATIQLVELALHGASLYSVSEIMAPRVASTVCAWREESKQMLTCSSVLISPSWNPMILA